MSLANVNLALSNFNCLMSSGLSYMDQKKAGDRSGGAEIDLGLNLINGGVRNEVAYDMRRMTGSNLGFLINSMAGYGNPEANAKGTVGMMGASLFSSMMNPWGYGFGYGMPYMGMPMMGFNPFFGGCYGAGMFGGGFFGGSNFFMRGCYC